MSTYMHGSSPRRVTQRTTQKLLKVMAKVMHLNLSSGTIPIVQMYRYIAPRIAPRVYTYYNILGCLL